MHPFLYAGLIICFICANSSSFLPSGPNGFKNDILMMNGVDQLPHPSVIEPSGKVSILGQTSDLQTPSIYHIEPTNDEKAIRSDEFINGRQLAGFKEILTPEVDDAQSNSGGFELNMKEKNDKVRGGAMDISINSNDAYYLKPKANNMDISYDIYSSTASLDSNTKKLPSLDIPLSYNTTSGPIILNKTISLIQSKNSALMFPTEQNLNETGVNSTSINDLNNVTNLAGEKTQNNIKEMHFVNLNNTIFKPTSLYNLTSYNTTKNQSAPLSKPKPTKPKKPECKHGGLIKIAPKISIGQVIDSKLTVGLLGQCGLVDVNLNTQILKDESGGSALDINANISLLGPKGLANIDATIEIGNKADGSKLAELKGELSIIGPKGLANLDTRLEFQDPNSKGDNRKVVLEGNLQLLGPKGALSLSGEMKVLGGKLNETLSKAAGELSLLGPKGLLSTSGEFKQLSKELDKPLKEIKIAAGLFGPKGVASLDLIKRIGTEQSKNLNGFENHTSLPTSQP